MTASAGSVVKNFTVQLNAAILALSFNATSVAFGDVPVNAQATQSASLTSTGTAPLTINGAAVAGPGFALSRATFPTTLIPDHAVTLEVGSNPGNVGTVTAQPTINGNSSVCTSTTIPLSGAGVGVSNFANVSVRTTTGKAIPPTFMGLSHEWGTAQTMMGDSTTGVDDIYRQLLRNLTAYGSGPIVLRIGGNSTDMSGEPTSTITQPLAELATDLGVHFYLGVNLGADNVNLAVDQAVAYAGRVPAGSLDGIEIGNEPDAYRLNRMRPSSYSFQDYLIDFNTWKTNILPRLPSGTKLVGPSWSWVAVLSNLPAFLTAEATSLTTVSQHYYVANGAASNPDDILLTPSSAMYGPTTVASAVATAHRYGIQFRMGELNSLYNGGGPGISNAFQSALWAVDTMFAYANVGVDGVNWQSGDPGAPYSPFSLDTQSSGTKTTYTLSSVHPLYYGLLFFQAATGNGAHLLPVTLNTHANLSAWATLDAADTLRLVLINKSENSTGTVNVAISGYRHARIYRLTAPSYRSTSGVTFAGQTFDGSRDGTIHGRQVTESVDVSNGEVQVPMPITSAALVVFTK